MLGSTVETSFRQFGGCLDEFPEDFCAKVTSDPEVWHSSPNAWLDTEYMFSVSSHVFLDVLLFSTLQWILGS